MDQWLITWIVNLRLISKVNNDILKLWALGRRTTIFVRHKFLILFSEELKIKRNLSNFHDSRVHACLYFITPNGHGLKSIDLVCMKKLDAKVNIIPIIAKADTINKTELTNFKVMNNWLPLMKRVRLKRILILNRHKFKMHFLIVSSPKSCQN